jgi:hypothetical protein
MKRICRKVVLAGKHRRIWNVFLLFVLPGIFYLVSSFLLERWGGEIFHAVPYIYGIYAVAGLTGILHFTISRVLGRSWRNAVITSIQIFALFSVVPYVVFLSFSVSDPFWTRILLGPTGTVILFLSTVLPELLWFIALAYLKRKSYVLTIAFALAAMMATFEIWPARASFLFSEAEAMSPRFRDPAIMKPFGKRDRETELRRSLETLDHLAMTSVTLPGDRLTPTVFGFPLFDEYPDILKLDTSETEETYYQSRRDPFSGFEQMEVSLDTTLDSDGDGLSDFLEAELLSNPHLEDSDGDGTPDAKDSDPLNPLVVSNYAGINAAILEYITKRYSWPLLVVENRFYKGRGEIANFDGHVLLLEWNQARKWSNIFSWQLYGMVDIQTRGIPPEPPYVRIGRILVTPSSRVAVAEVIYEDAGLVYFLVRPRSRWQVAGETVKWMPM